MRINQPAAFTKNEKLRELMTYAVFGALTTLVNWLSYWLLTELFGLRGYAAGSAGFKAVATAANSLAWIISVVFAFFTNKRFVFKSEQKKARAWREFFLFVWARVMSYLLFDLLLFNVLLGFMGDKPVKLITNLLVIVFNYFASKLVIFQRKK